MRRSILVSLSLLVTLSAFSADFKVHVQDPDGRPVYNARVTAAETTSYTDSAGDATVNSSANELEVSAPGFAVATVSLKASASPLTVTLKLTIPQQTVNVTAAQTELTADEAATATTIIGSEQLTLQQPVAASDPLRFAPGAVVNGAGRRGSLTSLFVRGGESRYNKVIVDGVPVNDAGGTFDFGVVPVDELERIEFTRGANSTLYGSDAMTSVVQLFSRTGSSHVPEFHFGADGGTFSTARGYASLAGAYKRLDYNLFGSQANSQGQSINDAYSNSEQGANIGILLADNLSARLRLRHSNSRTGVQSFWDFNGQAILPPDADQFARQNNFLSSAEVTWQTTPAWKNTVTGFEYNHKRLNQDQIADRACGPPLFLDCDFVDSLHFNRAGLSYRSEYAPRAWLRAGFGYEFEDENGFVNQNFSGFIENSHGLRRNQSGYGELVLLGKRASLVTGVRVAGNESFGTRVLPRVAVSALALRGNTAFTGTRLHFAYGEGFKEPRLEESFGAVGAFGPVTLPNPNLKAESNCSLEAGFTQGLGTRASFAATYFHNLFRDQIAFSFDPISFTSQYVNLNQALAHGAETELHFRPVQKLSFDASYTYTSTQILKAPLAFDPLLVAGAALVRRPKHSGSLLLTYVARQWGADLGGSFVGRRTDSDFLGLGINHAAGYARVDAGAWYAITSRVTAYANIENLLNRKYEEAAGYPALKANFRAGVRFRIGGE
jgi:vitamin B12 transporter